MIKMVIDDYTLSVEEHLPESDDLYCAHAALIERFGVETEPSDTTSDLHVHVRRGLGWPFLCVAQRYYPNHWSGGYPGLLLIPATHTLFIGAGERVLAYDLRGPTRLWQDFADSGFQMWQRHGDVVVMSAELGLAAWDLHGAKLWPSEHPAVFVEPPWTYRVEGDMLHLDVMGKITEFSLHTGPY